MPTASTLSFTWLGHGTFLFRSPGNVRLLIDPWLAGNPACPDAWKKPPPTDLLLLTHGHDDHVADALAVWRATGAMVIGPYELCAWLEQKGVRTVSPMNQGGTQVVKGVAITMVPAVHSSSTIEDGRLVYLGEPAGYVLRFENGVTVYFAGDTALFGDMRLIAELYRPDIAFLPIGDRYTMGPDAAAKATALLGVRQVVPMHYGTFPSLTGTPARLRELVGPGVQVLELRPGETAE